MTAAPPPRMLIPAASIAGRVDDLAGEIAAAVDDPFVMVVVLKGAAVFGADLLRALSRHDRHPRLEFIRLASYGDARMSSGTVRLEGPPPSGIVGSRILLVDDLLDSGLTLAEGRRLLTALGASAVKICVLLAKSGRRRADIVADFIGFDVGEGFIVGYGIDWAEQYRDLPDIAVIERRG